MNIKITCLGDVTNPAIACSTGEQNGWYMALKFSFRQNDEIEINTTRGNKYIKVNGSDYYNGVAVLSQLEFYNTDWLQLETGDNTFNVGTYNPNNHAITPTSLLYFTISYKRRYE